MRSSKRARSFRRRKGSREDEQSEDGIARTKGNRSKEWVVNSKRVTRSVSVIVTERRARQSAGQEKGSGDVPNSLFWIASSLSSKRWWSGKNLKRIIEVYYLCSFRSSSDFNKKVSIRFSS